MASASFRGPREWDEWSRWLMAGLRGRNQWRLPVLLMGFWFAQGRRTVSTRPRAAGVRPDYEDYYHFLASVGRNAQRVSWRLLSLVLKIVPLPERVPLVLAVRHPRWDALALSLRAMLYVRQRTLASIPPWRNWMFRTKLHLAARLVEGASWVLKAAGKLAPVKTPLGQCLEITVVASRSPTARQVVPIWPCYAKSQLPSGH